MDEGNSYRIGERVAVIGCSGSGKTTLAKAIAAAQGVPFVDTDALFWLPDWVQRPRDEYRAKLAQALSAQAWAFDGNLNELKIDLVLPRIDTLIWLDYPRSVVMRQLLKRTIRRSWTQETLFAGNTESWRQSFASKDSILLYAWRSHGDLRRAYAALFSDLPGHITPMRLETPAQAARLLHDLSVSGA